MTSLRIPENEQMRIFEGLWRGDGTYMKTPNNPVEHPVTIEFDARFVLDGAFLGWFYKECASEHHTKPNEIHGYWGYDNHHKRFHGASVDIDGMVMTAAFEGWSNDFDSSKVAPPGTKAFMPIWTGQVHGRVGRGVWVPLSDSEIHWQFDVKLESGWRPFIIIPSLRKVRLPR